jgi:hypothetical protein
LLAGLALLGQGKHGTHSARAVLRNQTSICLNVLERDLQAAVDERLADMY